MSAPQAPSEVDFVGGMGSLNLTEEPPIDPLFDFCALFKPQDLPSLHSFNLQGLSGLVFWGGMGSLNLTEDPRLDPLFDFCIPCAL